MAGDQIKVDYDRLGDLAENLSTAVAVLQGETESMEDLGNAVGDGSLRSRTNEFRDSWDKRRIDIAKNLEWLRDSVKNIHEQLAETDKSLAQGLTDPAPSGS